MEEVIYQTKDEYGATNIAITIDDFLDIEKIIKNNQIDINGKKYPAPILEGYKHPFVEKNPYSKNDKEAPQINKIFITYQQEV